MIWTVGRYPSGNWDSGGAPSEYMGGWTCRVEAKDRIEALRKGKAKYYRDKKKGVIPQ